MMCLTSTTSTNAMVRHLRTSGVPTWRLMAVADNYVQLKTLLGQHTGYAEL
jgi:hypothetical protein